MFAPNTAAAARSDARSNPAGADLVSDDCTSGFEVVASLGRRRTSTVNEGIARLNIVLATFTVPLIRHPKTSCEAKRNNAIAATIAGNNLDQLGGPRSPAISEPLITILAHNRNL
jgi:hypothetical protein